MGGGLGRVQGGFYEMVFRAMVRDEASFYDPLGLESRRAFLRHYFGCEYDAVAWLEQRRANGAVVIAEGSLAPWFARRNVFRPLVTSASTRAGVEHDCRGVFLAAHGQAQD